MGLVELKEVGFWDPDGPNPHTMVDLAWARTEREMVLRYLADGLVKEHWMGDSWCRFGCWSGEMVPEMGSRDHTDGVWVWPEGFHHYITHHSVKPPQEFIDHIKRNLQIGR